MKPFFSGKGEQSYLSTTDMGKEQPRREGYYRGPKTVKLNNKYITFLMHSPLGQVLF